MSSSTRPRSRELVPQLKALVDEGAEVEVPIRAPDRPIAGCNAQSTPSGNSERATTCCRWRSLAGRSLGTSSDEVAGPNAGGVKRFSNLPFRTWMIWREQPSASAVSTVEYQNSARAVSWTALGSGASARSRSIRNRREPPNLERNRRPGSPAPSGWAPAVPQDGRQFLVHDTRCEGTDRSSLLSNFGQRVMNVRTSRLSTSSRSSTASPQRRTNALPSAREVWTNG